MALKKDLQYKVFSVVLSIWLVSMLVVYIPLSNLVTPTFPLTINNYTLTFFQASMSLTFSLALYLGLNELK